MMPARLAFLASAHVPQLFSSTFLSLSSRSPITTAITRSAPALRMSTLPDADAALHNLSRKAVAIALNYADHAKEMHSEADRAAPFWFFKPSTSYLPANSAPIQLPPEALVHHEVELGVVIGKPARHVTARNAAEHIAGYVCAIDLTARNWQNEAKSIGRPWSLAKGCDTFMPVSNVLPPDSIPMDAETGVVDVELYLQVNGEVRQQGTTANMIWRIPELIEHISKYVTLEEWDIILTGTPSGVGPVKGGDRVTAGIKGLVEMQFDAIQT